MAIPSMQFPDIGGNFLNAFAQGRQLRDQAEQRQDRLTLRDLMTPAMQGDQGALAKVAGISPQHANWAESAHIQKLRKIRGAAKYVKQKLETGGPQAAMQAQEEVNPFLAQLTGKPPTPFDPSNTQHLDRLLAETAWLDEERGTTAALQEFDAMTRDLPPEERARARRIHLGLDPRASSGLPFAPRDVTGADGRTREYAFDKRTGRYARADEAGFSQGMPQQPEPTGGRFDEAIAQRATQMIQWGVPEDQVDAWLSSQTGAQFEPSPESPAPPPGAMPMPNTLPRPNTPRGPGADPFVSPTPGQIKREEAYGGAIGKAEGERAGNTVQRQANVDLITRSIDETLGTIDSAIQQVPGFGTTGLAGIVTSRVPGTPAYDLRQNIITIKANLGFDRLQAMRDASPTGGALGQVAVQELEALQAAVKSLDQGQTDAQLMANMRSVRKHYENWKKAVQQSARAGGLEARPDAPAQSREVEWVRGADGKLTRRDK